MIILVSATLAGILVLCDITSPLRPVLTLWFLCVCPGMALVGLMRVDEPFAEVTLIIALSLALDTITAGTMLYAGWWSPPWTLIILLVVSVGGAGAQLMIARPCER
ncbi:MAG: hypothetical protein DLM57_14315 [Pseudonocardiales bacterium]|nr:MAG: hypothetical protein DLM57_14315 [Pseudonocardiales bacterium]